jgi:hypothetical protein
MIPYNDIVLVRNALAKREGYSHPYSSTYNMVFNIKITNGKGLYMACDLSAQNLILTVMPCIIQGGAYYQQALVNFSADECEALRVKASEAIGWFKAALAPYKHDPQIMDYGLWHR